MSGVLIPLADYTKTLGQQAKQAADTISYEIILSAEVTMGSVDRSVNRFGYFTLPYGMTGQTRVEAERLATRMETAARHLRAILAETAQPVRLLQAAE